MDPDFFSNVVDGDDIGMVQGRCSAGLMSETADSLLVTPEIGADHLEGDFAVQLAIMGQVDIAHAPGGDMADYLERTQGFDICKSERIRLLEPGGNRQGRHIHEVASLFVSDQ